MLYKNLLQSGKIGGLDVKNRVVVTPTGLFYADSNGEAGDNICAYLEERARGGAGVVMTGIISVDSKTGIISPNELVLENRGQGMAFARLAAIIHKYDTKLILQLYHPGKCTTKANLDGITPWSVSPIPANDGTITKEMTEEDIQYIIDRYVNSALLAKKANVDGIEIHAAHGYLLGQFLTPYYNKRTDNYGGTLENRMRIVIETYRAIRKAVGEDFVVGIRISADEYIEGGNTLKDGIEMARIYDDLGMDFINVNCGIQESAQFNREPPSFQQGWKKHLAKAIKEAVKCPVIAVNTVKKPDFAESLLEEKVCDFVGLSRGHLADPFFTKKVLENRENEIRTCISCLNCMGTQVKGVPPTCTVNAALGREREFSSLNKNGAGNKIVVIGGGPGGLESSRILAERGFEVTLFEKNKKLGGQLNYAEKPPKKEKISWLKNNMIEQVKSAGVNIITGKAATINEVEKLDPVGVFVSTGANPICPSRIPGISEKHVHTVPEVLTGEAELNGKEVAIIGAGMCGLETAAFLGSRGCKVTVIEMCPSINIDIFPAVVDDMLNELKPYDVKFLFSHSLEKINENSIEISKTDNTKVTLKTEAIVLSLGVEPDKNLVSKFKNHFNNTVVIGDANRSGKIINAITDGFCKAWVFDY